MDVNLLVKSVPSAENFVQPSVLNCFALDRDVCYQSILHVVQAVGPAPKSLLSSDWLTSGSLLV